MGAVYEATHARLAGRYAIKVLLGRLSDSPEALSRFNREARITSLLQHPNVVQVIDYNTAADGTEYLVMEYLAGENLERRLFQRGPISIDSVVAIVEQVSAGLAAAHAHGIVHKDLKPDNIFLVPVQGRKTESVKILDFGISQAAGWRWGQASDRTMFGTPQYMSPEQVDGRFEDVDGTTDQFALAVVTHEMLTGRNPFLGGTVAATFSRIMHGDPGPTGLGRDVDLVVNRGMAKSKRDRFPCVTHFSDALRAVVAGRRVHVAHSLATTASAGRRVAAPIATANGNRGLRRRNWALGLVAALVAIVSVSFVAAAFADRQSSLTGSPSAAPASKPIPRNDQAHARRQVVLIDRQNENKKPESKKTGPLIEPLPLPVLSRAADVAREVAPRRPRRTSTSVSARPRLENETPLPHDMDDDATMPLDDKGAW
jgi:serine/threonine protein kinase